VNNNPTEERPPDPPCNTILYRTIRRSGWFDPDDVSRVKAEAFMRRRPKLRSDGTPDPGDDDGLSVFDSYHVNPVACLQSGKSGYGVASLHVGTLRDLGLKVVRDPTDQRKLLIVDLPFENPNDAVQERLLDAVADTARIVCRRKWQEPK
jgi:hypothetical protein